MVDAVCLRTVKGRSAVQVRVSEEIGTLLDEAANLSNRGGKCYVGVEHLFEAVVSQPRDFSQVLTDADWSCLHQAVERAYRDAWRGKLPPIGGDIFYTPRCAAITHEAAHLAARLLALQPAACGGAASAGVAAADSPLL